MSRSAVVGLENGLSRRGVPRVTTSCDRRHSADVGGAGSPEWNKKQYTQGLMRAMTLWRPFPGHAAGECYRCRASVTLGAREPLSPGDPVSSEYCRTKFKPV